MFGVVACLRGAISVRPVSSSPKYSVIPGSRLSDSGGVSFLGGGPFYSLFRLFRSQGEKKCALRRSFRSRREFRRVTSLFALSVARPSPLCRGKFTFSVSSCKLSRGRFLGRMFGSESRSGGGSLLILPPVFCRRGRSFCQEVEGG